MGLLDPTSETEHAERKPLVPRVDSLAGKRIGLWDSGKPSAGPVLTVLEERLAEKYPDATFDHYSFGRNGVNKAKDEDELAKLTDWASQQDVCIGAMGDCGSCTKFVARGIEAIEDGGTPAAGCIDEAFELDYQSNAIERGRPLRYKKLPVRSETVDLERVREELTDDIVVAVEDELTRPLTDEERQG